MPARAGTQAAARRGRRQGYSLVELAIVLAVLGLLLSGAVLPIGRQLEDKAYDRTSQRITDAIDAVVGYAASRRSPGMNVLYLNLNGNTGTRDLYEHYGHRIARVPEGRPYLPCPDVNGDGIEDRSAVYVPMVPAPDGLRGGSDNRFALRGDGGIGRDRAPLAEDFDDGSAANNAGKHAFGVCEQVRGDLPWATLGLPPTDSWGAALTYVVHPVFSTAAYGFDQATRAGAFIPFYETAAVAHLSELRSFAQRGDRRLGAAPMVVCRPEDLVPGPGTDPTVCRPTDNIDNSTLHSNENPFDQYSDDYSRYVADFLLNPNVRDVTDGIPFVIISHGPNRFGAATYEGTNRTCVGYPSPTMPPFTYSTIDIEEVNALFGSCYPYDEIVQNEDPTRISNHSTRAFDIIRGLDRPYNYVFATTRVPIHEWEPKPAPLKNVTINRRVFDFDDLVGWLTRRELGQRMRDAGVFPLPETFDGLYSGLALFPRPEF